MKLCALILGTLLAALTARAEESTVARAEVEKLFQGKKPFAEVSVSAAQVLVGEYVVGDMIARKNPMFPHDRESQSLREGQVVLKEVSAHAVLQAQEQLEKQWGRKAGKFSPNSVTNAIQPYFFDWVNERKISRRELMNRDRLNARDVYCLREGSAPLFQLIPRNATREQLKSLGIKGLRIQYTVAPKAELPTAKLSREADYLILTVGRDAKSSQCLSASQESIRGQIAALFEKNLPNVEQELVALREMLEAPESAPKHGSVIESRVGAKAALLAEKAVPTPAATPVTRPANPAL